jgi:hypothetical protein
LFVRGPEFKRQYEAKDTMKSLALHRPEGWVGDNTNLSRLIALRRGLAPIVAARWTIQYAAGAGDVITNDLGYVNSRYAIGHSSVGWAIPLSPDAILHLTPCPDGHGRKVLFHSSTGEWRALIERQDMRPRNHIALNASIAEFAREFIIGPNRDAVEAHARELKSSGPPETLIPQSVTSHRMQIVHEMEWDRLVCAIRHTPKELKDIGFDIDWNVVASDWYVMPLVPTNMPDFQGGIQLRGKSISLYMSEVPGFTDYAEGPFPWERPKTEVETADDGNLMR